MAVTMRESLIRWAYRIAVLAFAAVIVYLLAMNLTKYHRINRLQSELNAKKKQLVEAQRESAELRSRYQFMQTEEYIKQQARVRLDFVLPNEIRYESVN